MKHLLLTLALTVLCLSAKGQNLLVKFYPDNQPYQGATNYPALIRQADSAAVVSGWNTNFTVDQYTAYANSFSAAYQAAQSNALYQAQAAANTNYANWYSIYTNMPAGMNDSSNRMATFNSLLGSWQSGTNTAAGTNAIIKQTLQQNYYTWVYLNQIINYLSKLGPGLQTIYDPTKDTTIKP